MQIAPRFRCYELPAHKLHHSEVWRPLRTNVQPVNGTLAQAHVCHSVNEPRQRGIEICGSAALKRAPIGEQPSSSPQAVQENFVSEESIGTGARVRQASNLVDRGRRLP